jgi:ABC-2 type transport system ATP-binding protein
MAACSYVGRVGGLAIALGIGSALLGGTALSWADDAGTGPSSDRSGSTQSSTTGDAPSSVGTRGRAATAAGRGGESPRSAAAHASQR